MFLVNIVNVTNYNPDMVQNVNFCLFLHNTKFYVFFKVKNNDLFANIWMFVLIKWNDLIWYVYVYIQYTQNNTIANSILYCVNTVLKSAGEDLVKINAVILCAIWALQSKGMVKFTSDLIIDRKYSI